MTSSLSRANSRRLRWLVPGVVAAGVAAAAIVSTTSAGASSPNLPPKTAAQLLAAVGQVHTDHLSGTIVESANLGLPSLPAGDLGGSGLSLQALLTGSHTMRVWYGGPDQQRIAILAPMAERDIIRNGTSLWTYTSTTNQATHTTLPAGTHPTEPAPAIGHSVTPQQAAEQAIKAIDPSTQVVVDSTVSVAGRAAYQLDLVPRDHRSLIGSVRIAIDASTSLPLRVQVFATGASSPAFQVGFTDISYTSPSASVFDFSKPAGATMAPLSSVIGSQDQTMPSGQESYGKPSMLGSGWTSVVKIPGGAPLAGSTLGLVKELSTAVPQGQLITTPLVTILIAHNGTIFAGPVSGASLQHVAVTGHGL